MVHGTGIPNHSNTYGSISMIIYLYIKQHSITGLKYFGKTVSRNPFKYSGSGKYWVNHYKKYGKEHIKTLEIFGFDDQELCTEFALKFSEENNIVESKEWGNKRPENGLDGGDTSKFINYENVHKNIRGKTYEEIYGIEKATELKKLRGESNTKTKRGIPLSTEQRIKRSHPYGPKPEGFADKIRSHVTKRSNLIVTCPHCQKVGKQFPLSRWHFNNCKFNPNNGIV